MTSKGGSAALHTPLSPRRESATGARLLFLLPPGWHLCYISALDHVRKPRFSSIVHLTSVNKLFWSCHAWVILPQVREVHIFKHRLYISALEQARVLILGKFVLLGVINTIYKHCHAWAILWNAAEGLIFVIISALEHVMKLILCSCVLLVFINRIFNHYNALVILHILWEVWIPEHGLYLSFDTG